MEDVDTAPSVDNGHTNSGGGGCHSLVLSGAAAGASVCSLDTATTFTLHTELMEHQRVALAWMLGIEEPLARSGRITRAWPRSHGGLVTVEADHPRGGLLADDMGLGKTVECISLMCAATPSATIRSLESDGAAATCRQGVRRALGPNLVVAPAQLLHQWRAEIIRHAGVSPCQVLIYAGRERHKALADFLLANTCACAHHADTIVRPPVLAVVASYECMQREHASILLTPRVVLASSASPPLRIVDGHVVIDDCDDKKVDVARSSIKSAAVGHDGNNDDGDDGGTGPDRGNCVQAADEHRQQQLSAERAERQCPADGDENSRALGLTLARVRWHRILLDEAHRIRARSSSTSKAARALISRRRWCVTGTPLNNTLRDIGALAAFIGTPPYNRASWWRRRSDRSGSRDNGNSNGARESTATAGTTREGWSAIAAWRDAFMLRRTKALALTSRLPDKCVTLVRIELPPDERAVYDMLASAARADYARLGDLALTGRAREHAVGAALAWVTRLRRACVHPLLALGRCWSATLAVGTSSDNDDGKGSRPLAICSKVQSAARSPDLYRQNRCRPGTGTCLSATSARHLANCADKHGRVVVGAKRKRCEDNSSDDSDDTSSSAESGGDNESASNNNNNNNNDQTDQSDDEYVPCRAKRTRIIAPASARRGTPAACCAVCGVSDVIRSDLGIEKQIGKGSEHRGAKRRRRGVATDTAQLVRLACWHFLCLECVRARGGSTLPCRLCAICFSWRSTGVDMALVTLPTRTDRHFGTAGDAGTRSLVLSARVQATLSVCREHFDSDPRAKAVVFSQWAATLDVLARAFADVGIVTARYDGDDTDGERRAATLARFTTDEPSSGKDIGTPEYGAHVLLCSLACASVGLNLTRANLAVLVDPPYNPCVEEQAMDRVYRIGQERNVRVVRFVAPDTAEADVERASRAKAHLARLFVEAKTRHADSSNVVDADARDDTDNNNDGDDRARAEPDLYARERKCPSKMPPRLRMGTALIDRATRHFFTHATKTLVPPPRKEQLRKKPALRPVSCASLPVHDDDDGDCRIKRTPAALRDKSTDSNDEDRASITARRDAEAADAFFGLVTTGQQVQQQQKQLSASPSAARTTCKRKRDASSQVDVICCD